MEYKKYKVVIAQSGKLDVKEKKKYILQQFKYREYAENFSKKIIVTGSIQTDWVPPVFMSAENRWTAEEKY